jgi:DNA-binding CsgD family transcriptional regulator
MYREVTMIEVEEVLRLWRARVPTKRLAAQLGLDPKTVRRLSTRGHDSRRAGGRGVRHR